MIAITRPPSTIPPPIVTAGGTASKVDIKCRSQQLCDSCSTFRSSRVPRPYLHMLGSPIKPRRPCACNMAYTHCMRTTICLTPDRHGLPHNVELSWWCATRENTLLVFVRDHPIYDATVVYLTYKQSIGCTHNNTIST